MKTLLACSNCPTTRIVADGYISHAITPEKLADIGLKLGWEVEWNPQTGRILKTVCPECQKEEK